MKIRVITTWNNKLFKQYAHRFQGTYNWPFDLTVYNEDEDLFDLVPDLKAFVERNSHRKVTSFLDNAVRFSYKVYAYTHAIIDDTDSDYIIGIDADSVFYNPIDTQWVIDNLYREDCMMTYLGRGSQYSECGFLGFNMKHPEVKNYALEMKRMYDRDRVYSLIECHDSFVWDHVRKIYENQKGVKNFNIGDGSKAHVQARSVLGPIYDHTKGDRKRQGFSGENVFLKPHYAKKSFNKGN